MSKKLIPKGLTGLAVDESEEWGKHPLWDKIRLRNLGYNVPEETYSGGMLPDVNITASAPSIQTKEGTNLAKKMAADVYTGKMLMKDVPRDYQNYVEGEVKGAIPYALREHPGARAVGLGAAYLMGGIGGGMLGQLNVADKVFKPITNQFNKSILGKKVVKPGLEGIDKIFTPSKWGISSYLPESIGRFGDAAVQTSFVIDGLKGLKEQAEEGRLLKNPGETLLNVAMGSPLLSKPIKFGINGYNALRSLRKAEPIVNQVQEVAKEVLPVVNSVKQTSPAYQIERYGGGYMLKSLMEGNPLERQLSKAGTISINSIKAQAAKSGKVDLAVIDKVLNSELFAGLKAIDYNLFRKAVLDELITYNRTPDTRWEDYGIARLGFDLESDYTMPVIDAPEYDTMLDFIKGTNNGWRINRRNGKPVFVDRNNNVIPKEEVDKYYVKWLKDNEIPIIEKSIPRANTYMFSSERIPNGSSKHYNPNTLGHSRTYTTQDEPEILHVMESQSDWAQNKPSDLLKTHDIKSLADLDEEIAFQKANQGEGYKGIYWKDELSKLQNARSYVDPQGSYLVDNYPTRQMLENLKYAAEKGLTKMRYPTRETAAKIENYTSREAYFDPNGKDITTNTDVNIWSFGEKQDKELEEINAQIPKLQLELDNLLNGVYKKGIDKDKRWAEISDELYKLRKRKLNISASPYVTLKPGYSKKIIYDNEDILRRYSEFPKLFQKLFKNQEVRNVTDKLGNTWYEVDVPKNYLNMEWLFKKGGRLNKKKLIKKLRNG